MMVVDIVYHDYFTKHVMAPRHPECPERIIVAITHLRESGLLESADVHLIEAQPAGLSEICAIHSPDYIEQLRKTSEEGGGIFTLDTSANRYTYDAAVLAAGGGIQAVDRVINGDADSAFLLCRPPGHHAEYNRAFGFCFINNIAVAASHLLQNKSVKRVLIVDYDAHHGNGTQNAFYSRNDVLYIGLHQDGRTLFPGSGKVDELGKDAGRGFTINIPMYPGAGGNSYRIALDRIIEPVSASFEPDILLISAGFDCHYMDPLTNLGLTFQDIAMINRKLHVLAGRYTEGKAVVFLEGGYNLDVMAVASRLLVEELMGKTPDIPSEEFRESEICVNHTETTCEKIIRNLMGIHF